MFDLSNLGYRGNMALQQGGLPGRAPAPSVPIDMKGSFYAKLFLVSGDYTHENTIMGIISQTLLNPTHWSFKNCSGYGQMHS